MAYCGETPEPNGGVLHITPSPQGVLALRRKLGTLIREHVCAPMTDLIRSLNQALRGWANYHRYVVASDAFSRIDTYVYEQLWRMLRRRHPNKPRKWLTRMYWAAGGLGNVFAVRRKNPFGRWQIHRVLRICSIGITRYVKIKADANPYDPTYAREFWKRRHKKDAKRLGALTARQFRAQVA